MVEDRLPTSRRLGGVLTGEMLVRIEMSTQAGEERCVSGLTRPRTLVILTDRQRQVDTYTDRHRHTRTYKET